MLVRTSLLTRRAALAAALVAAAGCGSGDPAGPRSPCTGPVTLAASREARPRFTWSPDCAVARLVVLTPPSAGYVDVRWAVRGGDAGIASGVRYGSVPRGATEETPAADYPFVPGVRVSVLNAQGAVLASAPLVAP